MDTQKQNRIKVQEHQHLKVRCKVPSEIAAKEGEGEENRHHKSQGKTTC